MKSLCGILSAVVLVGATAGTASAKTFVGRDSDGYRYVYSNNSGSWTESINGTLRGSCTEVNSTGEYVELRSSGFSSQRTRLYNSEFYFWSNGRWIRMGSGRWTD
jgi:hypothetical protein